MDTELGVSETQQKGTVKCSLIRLNLQNYSVALISHFDKNILWLLPDLSWSKKISRTHRRKCIWWSRFNREWNWQVNEALRDPVPNDLINFHTVCYEQDLHLPLISRNLERHKQAMEGWVSPPLVRAPAVSKINFQMNSMNRMSLLLPYSRISSAHQIDGNKQLTTQFKFYTERNIFLKLFRVHIRFSEFPRSRWKPNIIVSLFESSRVPVLILMLATHGIFKLDKIFERRRSTVNFFRIRNFDSRAGISYSELNST